MPKDEYYQSGPSTPGIQKDIEEFVSPITGQRITSRSGLRDHNNRHGVTDCRDYSHEYLLKRSSKRIQEMTGQTAQAKRERRALIIKELDKHGR